MAKIKIPFNDKDYSVDESSLSSATDALKSHLSTVMNGSGAVINLDGISYNVDSAKLQNATDLFVSHLGTVAGSGIKVVVNGVEYSVDSAKMAGAIAGLETALGNLHSGEESSTLNEYGFYYNRVYAAANNTGAVIVDEDNVGYAFARDVVIPSEYGDAAEAIYLMNIMPADDVLAMINGGMMSASSDGTEITVVGYGTFIATDDDYHGIYFGRAYAHVDEYRHEIIFDQSGSAVETIYRENDEPLVFNHKWSHDGHDNVYIGTFSLNDADDYMCFSVSIDGKHIMYSSADEGTLITVYTLVE